MCHDEPGAGNRLGVNQMRETGPAEAEAGFRGVYASFAGRVYAFARRHSDPETAEQVVSDTFLAAWRRWDELPEPLLPWLLITARNCLETHWRGERRRRELVDEAAFQLLAQSSAGPESEVLAREEMRAALRSLSPRDREALLLVAWDGLTQPQAAQVLGISRNAFAARISRARRRLEAALTELDDRPDGPSQATVTANEPRY
ncbi:RNA polymerase sigma-70 factor (ECF subfamily) [Enemella evansiae]|nr:RNA polymerase sigma-70 factor (ECF subfamily) [Enemella evansiae]